VCSTGSIGRLRAWSSSRWRPKIYLALVSGRVERREFSIDTPLARDRSGRMRPSPDGLEALTECGVIHAGHDASLIGVRLVTGRTHQIRAHLAAIGHPVLGDPLYGAPSRVAGVPRLWLHAWRIGFPSQLAAALEVPREIECPLWPDLAGHLTRLGLEPPAVSAQFT
jgi:23S rRNA pseudouridine1911/1915/1917 synthase